MYKVHLLIYLILSKQKTRSKKKKKIKKKNNEATNEVVDEMMQLEYSNIGFYFFYIACRYIDIECMSSLSHFSVSLSSELLA